MLEARVRASQHTRHVYRIKTERMDLFHKTMKQYENETQEYDFIKTYTQLKRSRYVLKSARTIAIPSHR